MNQKRSNSIHRSDGIRDTFIITILHEATHAVETHPGRTLSPVGSRLSAYISIGTITCTLIHKLIHSCVSLSVMVCLSKCCSILLTRFIREREGEIERGSALVGLWARNKKQEKEAIHRGRCIKIWMVESDRDIERQRRVWFIEMKADTCINMLKETSFFFFTTCVLFS